MSASEPEKDEAVAAIDPPEFSDGAGEEVWPTPALRAGASEEEAANIGNTYFRQLGPDDPQLVNWLTKCGTLFAGNKAVARLSRLPAGYHLFSHVKPERSDAYLFGLPNGKKFQSPNEFVPHLQWLANDVTHDSANCGCQYCPNTQNLSKKRKHEGESETSEGDGDRASQQRRSCSATDQEPEGENTAKGNGHQRTGVEEVVEEDAADTRSARKKAKWEGEIDASGKSAASVDVKLKEQNSQVPTCWNGPVRYSDAQFDVLVLRLQLGPQSTVISPRATYWAPWCVAKPGSTAFISRYHYRHGQGTNNHRSFYTKLTLIRSYHYASPTTVNPVNSPLFAAFPSNFKVTSLIKGRDIDSMMETAKSYIIESLKRTTTLWAYQIIAVPSFKPHNSDNDANAKKFMELQEALGKGHSALFVRQDKVQILLKPTGNYLTGYAMLQEAVVSWANGKEKPLS